MYKIKYCPLDNRWEIFVYRRRFFKNHWVRIHSIESTGPGWAGMNDALYWLETNKAPITELIITK